MEIEHGLGLLALGLIVSVGVFWVIGVAFEAEQKAHKNRRENPLNDFHNYMDR